MKLDHRGFLHIGRFFDLFKKNCKYRKEKKKSKSFIVNFLIDTNKKYSDGDFVWTNCTVQHRLLRGRSRTNDRPTHEILHVAVRIQDAQKL